MRPAFLFGHDVGMAPDLIADYMMQAVLILLILGMIFKLAQEMRSDSPIAWWQLIASRGSDGGNYASASKLWLNVGAVLISWCVIYMVLQVEWHDQALTVVGFLGLYMAFISGVEAYAKHLKATQGDEAEKS